MELNMESNKINKVKDVLEIANKSISVGKAIFAVIIACAGLYIHFDSKIKDLEHSALNRREAQKVLFATDDRQEKSICELKIETAVLQERSKWLEKKCKC